MNIILKSLAITNFKGIREFFLCNFTSITEISGRNASGKSTIMDAFFWLMWDKNAENKETFNIKNTKDLSLNKLDHEVTATFDIDGVSLKLSKIYREKWTKKRGEPDTQFTGHETEYFINGVPKSLKEYQAKVAEILPESIAKLITNPFAFNALKWEAKREVLIKIAGNITDADIAFMKPEFEALLNNLSGKSLSDFKKEIAAKKKTIRQTLDYIPARIDEAEKAKPQSDDFEFIEKAIENKRNLITKIDAAISDKVNAHREESLKVIQKQNDLNRLKIELQNLESEAKRNHANQVNSIQIKIDSYSRDKNNSESNIKINNTKIAQLKAKIDECEKERNELRAKWGNINSEVIAPMQDDSLICPSCKQELPPSKIDAIKAEYETNFNTDKRKRLESVRLQGQQRKDFVERYEIDIKDLQSANEASDLIIEDANNKIAQLTKQKDGFNDAETDIIETDKVIHLREQIASFELPTAPVIDDSELKTRKATLQTELQELQRRLNAKEQIEKCEARIMQLQFEEREQSQAIADLERQEFTIDAFTTAKMNEVEKRVNSMFKLVKFTMFEKQINEGVKEVCTCLINGVPYPDVNTAGKIQGGLDIVSTLSAHYNIYAPIWIDNRESCAEIPAMASQVINLIHIPNQDLKIA